MLYLVTTSNDKPFLTKWFDFENHWIPNVHMVVYNLSTNEYTSNGVTWNNIEIDHL